MSGTRAVITQDGAGGAPTSAQSQMLRLSVVGGPAMLAASLSAYMLIAFTGRHVPFHIGHRELRFFDLRVYRGGARRILADRGLYARPIIRRLGFTYPPAAALALAPLALLPLRTDEIVVTVLNVAALVWMLVSTLRLARVRTSRPLLAAAAAGLAAVLLWCEPVSVAVGYGQIDLLITALVLFDVSRRDDAPAAGVALGVAAGLKLTPLLLILYLALAGRRRCAARAAVTFVATILVSFAALGHTAARYWGGLVLDSSRVGGAGDAANQSLRGALSRLTSTPHPGAGIELGIVLVGVGGLLLAVAAARRDRPQLGFSLAAITTLLVSPVSWTHHWVLAVPTLVLLGIAALRRPSWARLTAAAAASTLAFSFLPEHYMGHRHFFIGGLRSLGADPYVLAGLATLLLAAPLALGLSSPPGRSSPARPAPP